MARTLISRVVPGHRDYDTLTHLAAEVHRKVPGNLAHILGEIAVNAVEFVLDPIRTGRTVLSDLDNVEKTFVGLKIEHFVRDLLDAPKGVRDLVLGGMDVDVKNTVSESWSWMIPPETIRDEGPCLLVASSERYRVSWLGLIMAHPEYLNAPNRDRKCSIKSGAYGDILWLVDGVSWPQDRWAGVDMVRFRELRRLKVAGERRAAIFFQENLHKPIHRTVIVALLHDQKDPMKRLRGNGGARDILRPLGIALLSETYNNNILPMLGLPRLGRDEHIAIMPDTPEKLAVLRAHGALP